MTNSTAISVVRFGPLLALFVSLMSQPASAEPADIEARQLRRVAIPAEIEAQLRDAAPSALPGASWSFFLSSNQRVLHAIFISGTYASGTFPQCPIVPQYTMRILHDGQQIAYRSSNKFDQIFANDTRCGLYYIFTSNYSVLSAGTYEGRVDQPAYGASATGSIVVSACKTKTPFFEIHFPAVTDHFYTISVSDRDGAIALGGSYQGIAAYLERENLAGTLPFNRYYQYVPATDHFYTASAFEGSNAVANGWRMEKVEGYIYTTQKPGTVPFYRLSYSDMNTGDRDHYYTKMSGVTSPGWVSEGIVGYVCP